MLETFEQAYDREVKLRLGRTAQVMALRGQLCKIEQLAQEAISASWANPETKNNDVLRLLKEITKHTHLQRKPDQE